MSLLKSYCKYRKEKKSPYDEFMSELIFSTVIFLWHSISLPIDLRDYLHGHKNIAFVVIDLFTLIVIVTYYLWIWRRVRSNKNKPKSKIKL